MIYYLSRVIITDVRSPSLSHVLPRGTGDATYAHYIVLMYCTVVYYAAVLTLLRPYVVMSPRQSNSSSKHDDARSGFDTVSVFWPTHRRFPEIKEKRVFYAATVKYGVHAAALLNRERPISGSSTILFFIISTRSLTQHTHIIVHQQYHVSPITDQ